LNITFSFDEKQKVAIESVTKVCRENGIKGFIVGGAVRDAFLKISPRDIDMCFEEDPRNIIPKFDLEKFVYHDAFSTATVRFKNGVEIDFIRCRKEVYERNGSLPTIIPSGIKDDLERRDFTVNALAYDLVEGVVIDPFGGIADIKAKRIKSVHENSYREDPTRIFRAVKYAARYGFEIVETDEISECISEDVFGSISNERYFNEIYSLCSEKSWVEALLRCNELGILSLEEKALGEKSIFADYSDTNIRLLNLANSMNDRSTVRRIAENSIVHRELREALNKHLQCDNGWKLLDIRDNYEIFIALKNSSRYDRILLSFDWKLTYKLLNYERLMDLKLGIDGESVMRAGVKEGREVGRILDYVMMLKLNLGLDFEKKYFDENLGEILDVIKH
jgi:tRNA nucleotidyltransferase/poly(A) polymerase